MIPLKFVLYTPKHFYLNSLRTIVSEITEILHEWQNGSEEARELLLSHVYDELKRQARRYMSNERPDHTLQATALVHEAFLRLSGKNKFDWKDSKHFYGIASRLMRQVLVDHARTKQSAKRGGKSIRFSLEDADIAVEERAASILALHGALERLEKLDKRQASIVEMRFFGGMSESEIADSLDISVSTVSRNWQAARLWLYRELKTN